MSTFFIPHQFVTAKRKIISVTAPTVPKTLTTYYANADVLLKGGNSEVGKQVTVILEGTENVDSMTEKMNVTWTIANTNGAPYDRTPGVANTFRWTIPASAFSNYDAAGCANYDSGTGTITGKVTITNKAAPTKGTVLPDTKSKAKYTVTKGGINGAAVCYTKSTEKNVTSATIPATVKINGVTYKVTAIANNAFANNKKITKVTIGSNVKTIGKKAFYKCTKLKTVKIGKNVTTIGSNAFYGCSKLSAVSLGSKVTTISDKAFYKCTSLTKITLPSKVKKIGKQAFYGCKKLKSITIKTTKLTKKNVGSSAFKGIYAKATIKVPKNKLTSYKKILKAKGVSSKAKIKK